MVNQLINKSKNKILRIYLAVLIALFFGCASHKSAEVSPLESKRITDIVISENSESLFFTIKGNQPLTYTVIKQVAPRGVLFQFPDTALGIGKGVYSPPGYDIIRSIKAGEVIKDKTTTSSIFIALKRDTPYDLTPDKEGIKASFPKASILSKDTKPQKKITAKKPEPTSTQQNMPAANLLKAVTAKPLVDYIVVNVEADGAVKNYKSFTLDNPARIVIDIYNIKSPYAKEKRIAVDSEWVKRIRYFGHPDKVRVVLETHKDYLSKYSTHQIDTGLLIHIGNMFVFKWLWTDQE